MESQSCSKPCATSPVSASATASNSSLAIHAVNFLPDFTEHPKPKRRKTVTTEETALVLKTTGNENGEVSFLQDFIAGGAAGCASVVVGHPLDTMKVRVQNSATGGIRSSITEFGGVSSLFRGMGAPLGTAAFVNAMVFSSYGISSRLYDNYIVDPDKNVLLTHDPPEKAFICGAFSGLVQCTVICPMEHVKCRLQVQHGKGQPDNIYKGPVQATRGIWRNHGIARLYQGWSATLMREIPAFGLYFAVYDNMKDRVNSFLAKRAGVDPTIVVDSPHSHTWLASALAGGIAGSTTWAVVYPVDVIKTRVQTMSLSTPRHQLGLFHVGSQIVTLYGWRHLFRGLGITLLRAFPVNGTIFPVYEFTLIQIAKFNNWNK